MYVLDYALSAPTYIHLEFGSAGVHLPGFVWLTCFVTAFHFVFFSAIF